MAAEQIDRGEHHRAEDRQRHDVEQRLGDERPEHDREVLARTPGAAGHDQRARGLAEPRGQRRGHEHPDEGALHRIREPHPGSRQAARRIACQENARNTIAPHIIAKSEQHEGRGSS